MFVPFACCWASRNISADRSNLALSCSILFSHISIKELCMPIWSRTFSPFFTQDVEIGEVFFNFLNSIFHSRARSLPELLEFTRTLDSAAVSSPAVAFSGFLDTFLYTKNRYRSTFLFFSLWNSPQLTEFGGPRFKKFVRFFLIPVSRLNARFFRFVFAVASLATEDWGDGMLLASRIGDHREMFISTPR